MLDDALPVQNQCTSLTVRTGRIARGLMSLATNLLSRRRVGSALLLALLPWRARAEAILYRVPPSAADPRITRFNRADNWVFFNPAASPSAEALLYLPGTAPTENGTPFDRFQAFFGTAMAAGYHIIALQYDNHPAVSQVCPRMPDPDCSGEFREKRIFGDNVTGVINDAPQESIASRLTTLLRYLDSQHPGQGWSRYLSGGQPAWGRIAVGGHSQGSGMAAYIAKRVSVARVVLLSGPWDFSMPGRVPAPWLSMPSATPPDRWFALFHAQERQAAALRNAYAALGIPAAHIRVLDRMPAEPVEPGERMDAFHVSVISDRLTPRGMAGTPAYQKDWAFLLGRST